MRKLSLILVFFALAAGVRAQKKERDGGPKLVVNIVVAQLRADDLDRYYRNLSDRGIRRLYDEGCVFADARYDYMHTSTAAGLATLVTGSDPSTHGIVSEYWVDFTTGKRVSLIGDTSARGLGTDAGDGQYSAHNVTVPTLGERLREQDPDSRVVSIATHPLSAVALGGRRGPVYWMDMAHGGWASSSGYMEELPQWVAEHNSRHYAREWLGFKWSELLGEGRYINQTGAMNHEANSYRELLVSPVGNTLVAGFAKSAIAGERLGEDDHIDLLNICFDSAESVGERWGPDSKEVEDMLYRLDVEVADLLDFLEGRGAVVVLTGAHGVSDIAASDDIFSAAQFKVIMNGFLNAQYGAGDWVADYVDRQLYLNRNLVWQRGLSLEEVQNRTAAFALQFRGVSHVLTSTAMQSSYFGGSYAQRMQNSFYPRRGGDLTLNLMPGWIEERDGVRASSGGMYDYDTHVPLVVWGLGTTKRVVRSVNMKEVAPTLARIMNISRPIAADGGVIMELL